MNGFEKFTKAINMMGARRGYWVCIVLLLMGGVGAFARFLPHEKIAASADSFGVQFVSSVLFVLSGFSYAVSSASAKGHSSDVPEGNGSTVGLNDKLGDGDLKSSAVRQTIAVDLVKTTEHEVDRPLLSTCPECNVVSEVVKFSKLLADKEVSAETRAFLEDRLEGLTIDFPMDEERILEWGLKAVSQLDEFALLRMHVSDDDRRAVEMVCGCICDKMKAMDLALIDKESWDPSCHRAVGVVRSETASGTRIIRKRACGMTYKGMLVKKRGFVHNCGSI